MSVEISSILDQYTEFDSTRLKLLFLDNMIWPILVLSFIVFSMLLPQTFFSSSNISFLLFSSAALGALALAESLCLLSGNFDLSVGSIAGFSAMFAALFMDTWFPQTPGWLGIIIVLSMGGLIGLLNGVSVGYLGINPFLMTLGTFIIFRGGVNILSTFSIAGLPDFYTFIGGGNVGFVPVSVVLIIAIYLITWAGLKYTHFGLSIYAVGGDKSASEEAGINTSRTIAIVYVLSGVLSGLAGLIFTGFLGAASPTVGENSLFPAFAAAVIGGISLFGGRGNVIGAAGGVLLLGTIQAGLTMLQIDPQVVRTVNGIILVVAIFVYTFAERYRKRVLSG